MTSSTPWSEYLAKHLEKQGMLPMHLADAVGLNRGGMSQWRKGVVPEGPERIRAVAQTLETSIFEALVATGHITHDEWMAERQARPLADYSDEELLTELLRRRSSK